MAGKEDKKKIRKENEKMPRMGWEKHRKGKNWMRQEAERGELK